MRQAPDSPTPVESSADQAVWDELNTVLDRIGRAARKLQSPNEFYGEVISQLVPLLAASNAVVWLREAGKLKIASQTTGWQDSIGDRAAHEQLVAAALHSADVVLVAPGTSYAGIENTTSKHHLIAPVSLDDWVSDKRGSVSAIVLAVPSGRAPSSYQGAEQVLEAVSEIAAEYHARRELCRLSSEQSVQRALAQFAERVGGTNDLRRTAMAVANEGRRVVDCDRISVLVVTGRSGRLLASSGTEQIERRSRAARALERLAYMAVQLGEPIDYGDGGQDDVPPQVEEIVHRYVDEFHARQLLVVPVLPPEGATSPSGTQAVFAVERFAGGRSDANRSLVAEMARAASPALTSAIAWDELPLGSVLRTLGWLRMPRTLFRIVVSVALIAAVVTALLAIEAPLTVDVRGQLLPVDRQDVFAPRSGIVDTIGAEHGQQVAAGETLVLLRDPELAVELERLRGEQTTTERRLEAVRATRSTADPSEQDPVELYRLSGDEEELKTKLDNLSRQIEMLEQQTASLTVTSPIAGMVTTWQVDQRLAPGRPVERGQVLVSVADTAGDWMLELAVPDERLDLVREHEGNDLKVEYRLASDASQLHAATVMRVAERADLVTTPAGDERREVRIEAVPDSPVPDNLRVAAMRPGGSVRARIVVGNKSLGYVLLHDLGRTIRNWWEF